jgi:deoxycytidylate deaminase
MGPALRTVAAVVLAATALVVTGYGKRPKGARGTARATRTAQQSAMASQPHGE